MNYLLAYNNRLLVDNQNLALFSLSLIEAYISHKTPLETLVVDDEVKLLRLSHRPDELEPMDLRAHLALLNDTEYRWISRAQQLLNWRLQHKHCGRCGDLLEQTSDEMALSCVSELCRNRVYPRISPCIIVLVEKGDKALLAHNVRFTPNRFSTLAGFVEAGETVERAVAREVREEVGINVDNLRYFTSQAWPFPDSLMLAFFADYAGGELVPDQEEISEARWFSVDELNEVELPPPYAISRLLIDDWIERRSPQSGFNEV